jgi:hypothetical protein
MVGKEVSISMHPADVFYLLGAVLVLFGVVYLIARNEVVRRKLVCPRTGRVADVEFVRRFEDPEHGVRVKACSLFADPRHVTCSGECLDH